MNIYVKRVQVVCMLLLVACASPPSEQDATTSPIRSGETTVTSHGGPVHNHVSLVDNLRAKGLTVEPVADVQQPFLRAQGTVLRVSGGALTQPAEIQSYDYNDTDLGMNGSEAAAADASQIGPDGNPATSMITWVEPPHFFRKERAFVLYLGSDQAMLDILTELMGPQFSGH